MQMKLMRTQTVLELYGSGLDLSNVSDASSAIDALGVLDELQLQVAENEEHAALQKTGYKGEVDGSLSTITDKNQYSTVEQYGSPRRGRSGCFGTSDHSRNCSHFQCQNRKCYCYL